MIYFYESLKDNIKDNLYREDIPDILIEYIQCVMRIDDRLYTRCIEKRSQRLLALKWTSRKQDRQYLLQTNTGHFRQTSNIVYKIYIGPIDLNVVIKNQADNKKKIL